MQITVEQMYGDWGVDDATLDELFARSLNPRPSTMLYDKMGALGLAAQHYLLDIGSRDAKHTCELARHYGCRALGVEPVAQNRKLAESVIAEYGLVERVHSVKGVIEKIPADDSAFDFIWCRDVLTHVEKLARAFTECGRVLKRGGKMLVYQTFATPLLEPGDAARLFPPLAIVPQNMSFVTVQWALKDSGLTLIEKDTIGSEWREWWEENGQATTSKQLMQIARMRRARAKMIEAIGEVAYENELANCYWGVYQMLGKLEPMVYVLLKTE